MGYHRFDPDGDGISWTEMNEIVNKIDDDITEEETQELFERADTDGGGLIDFDEFYAAVHDDSQAAKGSLDLKKLVRKQEKVLIRADAAGRVFLSAFLLYPGLTQKIFDGFGCRDLGYGQTVLMVDYTIDCETAEYYTLLTVCIGLMFAWSIGLPVILWLSMFSVRKLIREEDEDTLQMYDFILGDYKTEFWYWEVIELTRKLILTGLIGMIGRGTVGQSVTCTVVAFVFFAITFRYQPFI